MIRIEMPRPRRGLPGVEPLESRRLMTIITVNSFDDILAPPPGVVTLRSAIQAANASPAADTINLAAAGTYRITLVGNGIDNSAGEFAIADAGDLTIQNASGGGVTIDGGGLGRTFDVDPAAAAMPFTVTFRGLAIQGGITNVNGGGIRASAAANVTLDHDIVQNNLSLGTGGGIAMEPGSTGALTLIASQVLGNRALTSGGGIAALGTGAVAIGSQSQVAENYAYNSDGGGIWLAGSPLTVVGAIIHDNRAINGFGGGIGNIGAGAVSIAGSLVEHNTAKTGGGYGDTGTGTLTVSNSFFLNNAAGVNGGGIDAGGPAITLVNTTVAGNDAVFGGGLHIHGTGTTRITDSSILGNGGNEAGGIDDEATKLIVTGSTFASNRALGSGGAIAAFNTAGDVSIGNSLFVNNATYISGGALFFLAGTLEVSASRFTGNGSQAGGAANLSATSFKIVNSTFDANGAATEGALLLSLTGMGNALIDDTFFGNAAQKDGAISVNGAANTSLAMVDDTVDGNTATTTSGGVEQVGGTLVVQGTILARNTAAGAPSDYTYTGGQLADNGFNLLGSANGSGGKFGAGTIVADPKLGPLVNNGGNRAGDGADSQIIPTQALLPGSPAFAKGIVGTGIPNVDERGFGRPGKPAIGAYEPQYAAGATPNQVFIENAFEVLFNRQADPGGLAGSSAFLSGGGTPTALIQLLQTTTEYLNGQVILLYNRYLDRAPSAFELSAVAGAMKSGATPEQLAASLVGTAEFFGDFGGNNDVFIQGAFVAALGRPTNSASELAAWDSVLASGTTRPALASLLLTTPEYVADLVIADFGAYIGRRPSPTDMAAFLGASRAGVTSPNLAAIALGASFSART